MGNEMGNETEETDSEAWRPSKGMMDHRLLGNPEAVSLFRERPRREDGSVIKNPPASDVQFRMYGEEK